MNFFAEFYTFVSPPGRAIYNYCQSRFSSQKRNYMHESKELGTKINRLESIFLLFIQGVSKGSLQNFRGDSRHEEKLY